MAGASPRLRDEGQSIRTPSIRSPAKDELETVPLSILEITIFSVAVGVAKLFSSKGFQFRARTPGDFVDPYRTVEVV